MHFTGTNSSAFVFVNVIHWMLMEFDSKALGIRMLA